MTIPHAETFEHDIRQEIKHKEGSMLDIATTVNDIGNEESNEEAHKKQLIFISIVSVLTLLGLALVGFLLFLYSGSSTPAPQPIQQPVVVPIKNTSMIGISNVLNENIGMHLANVQKESEGYIITITSYPPVFSFMLKNESLFGDEIATAVGNNHVIKYPDVVKKTTTTQIVMPMIIEEVKATTTSSTTIATSTKTKKIVTTKKATTTPLLATSTQQQGTSTPKVATSTKATTTPVIVTEPQTEYIFSDVTINNQNIRVAKSAYGTVAYAFIETNKLVISSSPEGIISLRSRILKK